MMIWQLDKLNSITVNYTQPDDDTSIHTSLDGYF